MQFLVDTGADISVISRSVLTKRHTPEEFKLYAANGSSINTYGEKLLTLNLGLRRQFPWRFIIADVSRAILGADFLRY